MIESLHNDKVKRLVRLSSDNRFRKKSKLFCVEGRQENKRALSFGFEPESFFVCQDIYGDTLPQGEVHLVSKKVYEKIAYRSKTEGIIGIYTPKNESLEHFKPKKDSSVIIVESVEKPGNLGAILRSCEAFGIDALIVTDARADFYNPNVIRSSVGCLFGMNIYQETNEEVFHFLQKEGYQIFSTYMSEKAEDISQKDYTKKSAIIFGTEHSGIGKYWMDKTDNVLIPMAGSIDSLNLSNAVAICCYEILRQKKRLF